MNLEEFLAQCAGLIVSSVLVRNGDQAKQDICKIM
jgi:hypothetical protein